MWCLCEWWIDANHDIIEEEDPDEIRVNHIGVDSSRSRFWYFGDFRLYKETRSRKRPAETALPEKTKKLKMLPSPSRPTPQRSSPLQETPSQHGDAAPPQAGESTSDVKSEGAVETIPEVPTTASSEGPEILLQPSPKTRTSQRYETIKSNPFEFDQKIEKNLLFQGQPVFAAPALTTRRKEIARKKPKAPLDPSSSRRSSRILVNEALRKSLSEVSVAQTESKAKKKKSKRGVDFVDGDSDSNSPEEITFSWGLFCSSLQEWERFQVALAESQYAADQALSESMSEDIFPKVMENLRSQEKRSIVQSLPRKRSARIFQKVSKSFPLEIEFF